MTVRSPLAEHAKSLKKTTQAREPSMQYPMYTAPLESVLEMTAVRSHEELLSDAIIVQFNHAMGKAMFVSHQWVSNRHADPDGRQFKVLQDALSNLLNGTRVSPDVLTEMLYGLAPSFSKANLTSKIFIWYDFFSIPQITVQSATESQGFWKRQSAIQSIPAYIDKCQFFVALCPLLTHLDTSLPMDQFTWAKRGWCRVEKMVRHLLAPNEMGILIESPNHMCMLALRDALFSPFGAGQFTVDQDRHVVGQILRDILELKLYNDLRNGDLFEYRFFLNRQEMLLKEVEVRSVPASFKSPSRSSSSLNVNEALLDVFLTENGFVTVTDRDEGGFSPLCFAVTKSRELVKLLLAKKANPNDRITKGIKKYTAPKNLSVLSICVLHQSHEALALLLRARANPNQRDANGSTPLIYCAFSNDAVSAKLLCDFGADPSIPNLFGFDCMDAVFSRGASDVAKELWSFAGSPFLLHIAMFFYGGDPDFVSMVVERGFALNLQFRSTGFEARNICCVAFRTSQASFF